MIEVLEIFAEAQERYYRIEYDDVHLVRFESDMARAMRSVRQQTWRRIANRNEWRASQRKNAKTFMARLKEDSMRLDIFRKKERARKKSAYEKLKSDPKRYAAYQLKEQSRRKKRTERERIQHQSNDQQCVLPSVGTSTPPLHQP